MVQPDQVGLIEAARGLIAMPGEVSSPLGELRFVDGIPDEATMSSSYELLDLIRGIDVYMNTIPGASLVAMRTGLRSAGVDRAWALGITAPRANSGSFFLTANTETTYGTTFLDLKADGPTVVEAPPNSLCVVDDFWFRYVADMGLPGPDQGQGGQYLFLPPGYDGEVPDGYFTYRCPTYTNWLVVRALGGVDAIRTTRIYPLDRAERPPEMVFVNLAEQRINTVHSNDYHYYEEIDTLVQEEPAGSLDPERTGQLAAIGIVHGQPFEPDERLRGILAKSAPLAAAIVRSLFFRPRDPQAYYYEGSSWKRAFVGGSYEFLRDGARLLDARAMFHYAATVITPAMVAKTVGIGSQYAYTAQDADGDWLDGGRTYRLRLPNDIPAKNFWSIDVYDCQTRSLLETGDPYPSIAQGFDNLSTNDDGSIDIWFAPTSPDGHEANWIQTVPGKSWFAILRLYGPLEPWFDQTWRPSEIQKA
jgi:hypothetical protein